MKKSSARKPAEKRQVNFSNLTKVLYPEAGFTKGQVIEYYTKIAPIILPHLRDRPLTLKRYPNGVAEPFFYEKRCPPFKPSWFKTVRIPSETKGYIDFCTVDSVEALQWVANLASLELHTMLCRADKPDRPTMMVFDLDPGPPAGLLDCLKLAVTIRKVFAHMKLEIFPKTSGGKGVHMYVPLNTPVTFEQTKAFARQIALLLEKDSPKSVVSNMSKAARAGKIFVDWSQNDSHKTTVCPYSLRARTLPTVSTPVSWEEVESVIAKKKPERLIFEAPDVVKRVSKIGDLFEPVLTMKQRLPALSD